MKISALFRTILGFALIITAALVWTGCASTPPPAPAQSYHGDGKGVTSPSPIKIRR